LKKEKGGSWWKGTVMPLVPNIGVMSSKLAPLK